MSAVARIQRDEAVQAVADSYDDWLLDLPHIYDRGDRRARCDALKALEPVASDLRALSHCLIRNGEAAMAVRLEEAFRDVQRAARAICTFVRSSKFRDREWLYGDTSGQSELVRVRDESIDLVPRAASIVSDCLRVGRTPLSAFRQATFWLAWNLRLRDAEPKDARKVIHAFLSRRHVRRGDALRIAQSAVWRAFGRLELGYEYFQCRVGASRLKALDAFTEELQLASLPPAAAATPGHIEEDQRNHIIATSWYPARRAAKLLRYSRGHITRLVRSNTLEGAEVSSKLFINPVSVHSHPRYKGRPTDAPAVAEMAYDCAACGNIITAAPESKPAKCPKCGGQNTLIRRRPKV